MKQSTRKSQLQLRELWRSWLAKLAILQLLGASLLISTASIAQPNSYLLDNVRVIVGDGTMFESAALLVEGGRILGVGERAGVQLDPAIEIIDMSGKTLMPALIDGHAHLGYEAQTSWGAENYSRENLIDHLQRYAYYGYSAVFSAGSDPSDLAYEVQQAQLAGEFVAARLLYAAGMAPPGEGPNGQFLTHALALERSTGQSILYGVSTAQEAVTSVREIAAKNIPVIKIWVDDRGGSQQKLEPVLYQAIAEEARANGIAVYAHQQYASDMPGLIEAGIDGFLHGRIGAELGPEIALQLAQENAFLVPNLGLAELRREAIGADPFLLETIPASVAERLAENEQRLQQVQRSEAREAEMRASFADLLRVKVDIVLGTDAGAVPDHFFGYSGHRELEIFVRLGMSPMQAIVAGTSTAARRLGLDDLGLLRPGYSADFIVLDENPLENIRNTRSISAVYLNGRPVDRAGLAAGFVK